MGISQDEDLVRQLLAEVASGQPDPPSDRQFSVRRRVHRRRWIMAAQALAVVLVVAGGVLGAGLSSGGTPASSGSRPVPAWALPWPDHRDGSVPQRVLRGAVTAWRHEFAGLHQPPRAGQPLIWYVGQTVAHGQVVAVMFEVQTVIGPRLVAGWATASEVMHGRPSDLPRDVSPWALFDVAAPKPATGLTIGLNVHGASAGPDRNPDNWIVVLAAPRVRSLAWTAPHGSGSPSSAVTIAIGTTSHGLLVADAGQLTGRVSLNELYEGGHRVLALPPGWVGVPGSSQSYVPQLKQAAPIRVPPGFRMRNGDEGQGPLTNNLPGEPGRLAFLVRCYGPEPVRLLYQQGGNKAIIGGRAAVTIGTIPCDNGVHEVISGIRPSTRTSYFEIIRTSELTSYRVEQGTVGR